MRRSCTKILAALVLAAGSCGCLGPSAIRYTRMRYNEVVRDTNDQQLLLNIVRLRYADSPVFIDLPTITSQFELAAGGSDPGPAGSQTNFGVGGAWGRDTPTLSYHPREGRELAKALLEPISTDLFSIVNAGANVEQLLLLSVNDINDVPNAPRATTLLPNIPDDNAAFLRGIRILSDLRDRDATELVVSTDEEVAGMSDPISRDSVDGSHLLDAARSGYVFRERSDKHVALLRRERELFLRIRRPYVHSAEMQEAARIFKLKPGLDRYRIKSELSEDSSESLPAPLEGDTVLMNMRSVLQIMTFLSKGVCVPLEHVQSGTAPTVAGRDGKPFDWTRVTAGHFVVHADRHRPHDAEVAVHYRGYWFYIAPNDVRSRSVLAIMEVLFALQESEDRKPGPLLALPLGGG